MTAILIIIILWMASLIYINKKVIPAAISKAMENEVKPYIDKYVENYNDELMKKYNSIYSKLAELIKSHNGIVGDVEKLLDIVDGNSGNVKPKHSEQPTLPKPQAPIQ